MTRLLAWAITAARFVATVVLPSPEPGLVMRMVFSGLSTLANSRFVRSVRNVSAIGERGLDVTKGIPSLFSMADSLTT